MLRIRLEEFKNGKIVYVLQKDITEESIEKCCSNNKEDYISQIARHMVVEYLEKFVKEL